MTENKEERYNKCPRTDWSHKYVLHSLNPLSYGSATIKYIGNSAENHTVLWERNKKSYTLTSTD